MMNHEEKYMQLYQRIRKEIIEGAWPHGSRLPSKRTLAAENGISVVTVEHAFSLLCDEGYAESRPRSGYYVTYRAGDLYAQPGAKAAAESSPVFAGEPDPGDAAPLFPYSVLSRAMRKVLALQGEKLLIKSPGSGLPELKDAISAYLMRSRGIRVSREQIIIGSGAEYLYGIVVQLLGHDCIYALEDPSYEKIRRVYEMNGVKTELLAMGNDGILSSALSATAGQAELPPPLPNGPNISAGRRPERPILLKMITTQNSRCFPSRKIRSFPSSPITACFISTPFPAPLRLPCAQVILCCRLTLFLFMRKKWASSPVRFLFSNSICLQSSLKTAISSGTSTG